MAKKLTTELQIENEKPVRGKTKEFSTKHSGIRLRVSPSGVKSFVWYCIKPDGKRSTVTLGRHPDMTLEQALTAKGKEQDSQRYSQTDTSSKPKNLGELFTSFYEGYVKINRDTHADCVQFYDNARFKKHKWLDTTVREIEASEGRIIKDILQTVTAEGGQVQGKATLSFTKQMLRYSKAHKYLSDDFCDILTPKFIGINDRKRASKKKKRKLTNEEIKTVWQGLDDYKNLSVSIRIALKLLLLTGLRSGELRRNTWDNVDFENRTLTIPVEIQKTRNADSVPFVVPLSPLAFTLMQELHTATGHGEYLFAGARDNPILEDKAFGHAVRRLIKRLDEMPSWSPHDLRRTCRSGLSALSIPFEVAEKCLNHSLNGFSSTAEDYDMDDYFPQRKEALDKWEGVVSNLVSNKPKLEIVNGH